MEWNAAYREERAKMLDSVPLSYEHRFIKDPAHPTWTERLRARLYTGLWFGSFMKSSQGVGVIQEASLVYALMNLLQKPAEWQIREHGLHHISSGVDIWTANGRPFCALYSPSRLDLRVWSQRRIWRAYKRIKRAHGRRDNPQIRALTASLEHSA